MTDRGAVLIDKFRVAIDMERDWTDIFNVMADMGAGSIDKFRDSTDISASQTDMITT